VAFVLDASVAIAWFMGRQATPYTNRLRLKAKREALHVPALWRLEVVNAIRSLQRRAAISEPAADTAIDLLSSLAFTEHPNAHSMRDTLALARRHGLSSYDATYLALARDLRLPLACSDGPLRNALSAAGVKLA
jgi:predicted nucleic acid-binding protein